MLFWFNISPAFANIGQFWPNFVKCGPNLAKLGRPSPLICQVPPLVNLMVRVPPTVGPQHVPERSGAAGTTCEPQLWGWSSPAAPSARPGPHRCVPQVIADPEIRLERITPEAGRAAARNRFRSWAHPQLQPDLCDGDGLSDRPRMAERQRESSRRAVVEDLLATRLGKWDPASPDREGLSWACSGQAVSRFVRPPRKVRFGYSCTFDLPRFPTSQT